MTKRTTPITVFCRDADKATRLSATDRDSQATVTGPGTLSFHALIARHGAGEFTTLYVPMSLQGKFKPPVGGVVRDLTDPVGRCLSCGITVFYSSDATSLRCSSCERWAK